jgi:hypothetical protein
VELITFFLVALAVVVLFMCVIGGVVTLKNKGMSFFEKIVFVVLCYVFLIMLCLLVNGKIELYS